MEDTISLERASPTLGDWFIRSLQFAGRLDELVPERLPVTSSEILHPELWMEGWRVPSPCDAPGKVKGEAGIAYNLASVVGWGEALLAAEGWQGDCLVTGTPTEWRSSWKRPNDVDEFLFSAGSWLDSQAIRFQVARTGDLTCTISW